MANSTTAYGLRALGKFGSNPSAGGQSQYQIVNNYSSSIYQGDVVTIGATGYLNPVQSSSTGNILGVFNGCLIEVNPTTKKPKWQNFYTQTNVAQGNIDAYVIDDPNQLYLVKSTGTALGQTAVGTAFGIVYAAGSSTTGLSGTYLSLGTASSTGQLLVLSTSQFIDNIPATTNEDFVVKIHTAQSIA
jgi:hypothetical protein